nr:hypothetical protein [Tanacetum cinerariifolium]
MQSSFDTTMPPPTAVGTRLSTSAKGKQPAKSSKGKGLSVLFEVTMTEDEHMKLATKRSLQQTYISQASGSGADEGTEDEDEVDDISDDQEDEDDQDDDNQDDDDQDDDDQDDNDDDQDTDNDGDDFVHPKLSIHEEEAKDEESFDPIVQAPKKSNDKGNNDASLGMNVGAQAENEDFINKLNEKIQKIINKQVKELVKVQVSKILPKIEKIMNEQLEAEVLTRSSNSSETSYAVAADLSELELKKILIEKMEINKSIHRSNVQRNLYKALVDAYECDKLILDTYRDTVTLKRRRDDADKDEEPSARSDRGSKRRREGKEPESTSTTKEKATKTTRKSTEGSKSHQKTTSESAPAEEPMQTTQDLKEPSH